MNKIIELDEEGRIYTPVTSLIDDNLTFKGPHSDSPAHMNIKTCFIITSSNEEGVNVEFKNIIFTLDKDFEKAEENPSQYGSIFAISTQKGQNLENAKIKVTFTDCEFQNFNNNNYSIFRTGNNVTLKFKRCHFNHIECIGIDAFSNSKITLDTCNFDIKKGYALKLNEEAKGTVKLCEFSSSFKRPEGIRSEEYMEKNPHFVRKLIYWGVSVYDDAKLTMKECSFRNFFIALLVENHSHVKVSNTRFEECFRSVWQQQISKLVMDSCRMTTSFDTSVHILDEAVCILTDCDIVNNFGTGLYCNEKTKVNLHYCRLNDNCGNGIDIWKGQSFVGLWNCVLQRNTLAGIALCDNMELYIDSSTLEDNCTQNIAGMGDARIIVENSDLNFTEKSNQDSVHCFFNKASNVTMSYCEFNSKKENCVLFLLEDDADVEIYDSKFDSIDTIAYLTEHSKLLIKRPTIENMSELKTTQDAETWVQIIDKDGNFI